MITIAKATELKMHISQSTSSFRRGFCRSVLPVTVHAIFSCNLLQVTVDSKLPNFETENNFLRTCNINNFEKLIHVFKKIFQLLHTQIFFPGELQSVCLHKFKIVFLDYRWQIFFKKKPLQISVITRRQLLVTVTLDQN